MTDNCTVVRHNERSSRPCPLPGVEDSDTRRIKLSDTGMWTNQNLCFARALGDMIVLAEAIFEGALLRNESRGAHYKPAYPNRSDEEFLKTTIAEYDPAGDSPRMSYAPVDISLAPPRAREYGKKPDAPAATAAKPEKAMA